MSISDDLGRLADLHARGALTDDEFDRAKARLLAADSARFQNRPLDMLNGLRRSQQDRWLGGVCGGLAQSTGVQAWIWRLLFVLFSTCAGSGAIAYVLLWLLVPAEPPFGALPGARHSA